MQTLEQIEERSAVIIEQEMSKAKTKMNTKLTPQEIEVNIDALRAFFAGERIEYLSNGKWIPTLNLTGIEYMPHRRKPKTESQIAPGHNPAKLTVEQVGEGWRLLDPDEIKDGSALYEIEAWGGIIWLNNLAYVGHVQCRTYRTKLTRQELAALREPYRPYAPGESPVMFWTKRKQDNELFTVQAHPNGEFYCSSVNASLLVTAKQLLAEYVHQDGSPCGVKK